MRFSEFLESQWNVPWPVRQGAGDDPREQDTPPGTTAAGDYILFHGTDMDNAKKILSEKTLKHDDWRQVGVCTTASAAGTYASIKALKRRRPDNPSVVLRLVVDRNWLLKHKINREIGGSGKDQWLIDVLAIPPNALKELDIYKVSGEMHGRFADGV